MAENNKRERSNVSSPPSVKKDTARQKCESCMDDIQENDAGKLACQSRHMLCGECSAIFCESLLAAGSQAVMPPKCSICRGPIPALSLERILTPEQLSTYLNYVAIHTMQAGERIVSCVNCSYCEVHTDEPSIFWCRNGACQTVHCVGCKAKLPPLMEESDIEDEEDEDTYMEGQSTLVSHLKCSALREEKSAFDNAIAFGGGMPCPGCGVVGRKDGMCTHMSCSGCSTVWCYLCGLSVEDCDKAPRYGEASKEPIYGHNEDWEENEKRCPMYISMIANVDEEWDFEQEMEEDEAYDEEDLEELCMNKYHRWLTLQKLHDLRNELGEEKWLDLRGTFASVRNCDFSNQEIANAGNVPLFTRQDTRLTNRRRTGEEDEAADTAAPDDNNGTANGNAIDLTEN